jgi:hypothetical protein
MEGGYQDMSTRDERVVSLKFDNAQFERGASESMSTLDKLKEKLKFKDSEKDLDKLQKSVDSVTFTKIQQSLESLEKRFSVMGIAGMRVIENLVDKALSGLGKIEQATLGQIRKGGWSRAMNLANAQFQIEGLGYAWDQVEKAVSYGVKDTAYGLDAAAQAASQLAASGVDFTKVLYTVGNEGITQMHKALRGISGVAAMTNSQYEDISRIFTRVAGQGKVMATDLNSIAARGLNAAAEIGKYLGVTEAQVRDMVSKSQIDFMTFADAMDTAFGSHAKEANKTFNGALSNMKAALSRIGALFAGPVVNKTNTIFIALTKQIDAAKKSLSDLEESVDGKTIKIERFQSHFEQAWTAMTEAVSTFVGTISPDWFQHVADVFDAAAIKMRDFFLTFKNVLGNVSTAVQEAKDIIGVSVEDAMAAFYIFFNGKYGNGAARVKALTEAGRDAKKVQALINDWYKSGFDPAKMAVMIENTNAKDLSEWLAEVRKNGFKLDKVQKKLGTSTEELTEELSEEEQQALIMAETYRNIGLTILNLSTVFDDSFAIIGNVMKGAFYSLKKYFDPYGFTKRIGDVAEKLSAFSGDIRYLLDFTLLQDVNNEIAGLQERLKNGASGAREIVQEIDRLREFAAPIQHTKDIFDSLARSFYNIIGAIRNLSRVALTVGKAIFRGFISVFTPDGLVSGIEEITWTFEGFTESLLAFAERIAPIIEAAAYAFFSLIKSGITIFKNITVRVLNFFSELLGVNDGLSDIQETGEELVKTAEKVPTILDKVADVLITIGDKIQVLPDFFTELFDLLAENDGVQRLGDAFGKLGEMVGGAVVALNPFSKTVDEATGDAQEKKSVAAQLAEAIGWIADKLAAIVEWVPKTLTAIDMFFEGVRNGFRKLFYDDASNVSGETDFNQRIAAIYGIPETIKDSVSSEKAEDTAGAVEKFFHRIGEAVKNGFSNIHLEDLKNLAIISGIIYSLWAMNSILNRIRYLPTSLGRLFQGIGVMIEAYGIAWKTQLRIESYVIFIKALVEAIISITGWMVLLGSVDTDVLYKGAIVVGVAAGLLAFVTKQIAKIGETRKNRNYNQQIGMVNNNVQGTATTLLGFGAALAGLGVALYAFFEVVKFVSGIGDYSGAMIWTLVTIGAILGAVLLFALGLSAILNKTKTLDFYNRGDKGTTTVGGGNIAKVAMGNHASYGTKNPLTSAIYAISVMLLSLSAAIAILAVAMAVMKATKIDWKQIGMISALLAAIAGSIAIMFLGFSAVVKNLNRGQKASSTLSLMVGMVATIIAFAYAIKIMFTTLAVLAGGGGLLALIAGSSSEAVIGGIAAAFIGLSLVIVAIGGAIALMARSMAKLSKDQVWALPVALLGIAAVIGAMGAVLTVLSMQDPNGVVRAGIVIGALIAVMALAARIMSGGKYAKNPKELGALALGIIAIGAAIGVISYAIKNLVDVPGTKMFTIAGAIGVVILALTAFAALVGKNEKRIAAITSLGKMVLGFGAGALLFGAGLMLINASLPAFAEGLDKVLTAVDKHRAAVLIVGGVIIGVMTLAYKFLKPLLSVLNALSEFIASVVKGVGKGIGAVASTVGNVLSSVWTKIANFFKEHGPDIKAKLAQWGNSFKTWILGLPTKIKALLTILMLSLGAQMSSENGSASLLGTVGKVFSGLMKYLRDGMPKFVGEILDLLLSAVEALGNGVRKRSARFAAAFWVIVSTLIGLLGDILGQGLGMLGIKLDFSDAAAKLYKKAAYNSAAAEFEDVSRMYDLGEATLKEKLEAQKKLAAAQEDLVKSSGDEVRKAALQDKGVITDSTSGITTSILHLQEAMERIKGMGEVEAFDFVSKLWGEDTAKKLSTALEKMGTTLTEFGTDEGFKKVMEFAALREAVELEQARMSDLEDKLGYANGTLYDKNSKTKWADNDYGEASWFLTVFAPYLKTDQKYIDYRNKLLEDTDKLLDFQAEIQAKAYNITHGTKLNTEEFAKEIAANKKLYGEQTDYYKRMQALHPGGGMEDATLKGNLNYNLSQGYDIRSDIFYANQMTDGFLQVFEGLLGNGLSNSRDIVVASFQGMATDKEIIAAANDAGNKNATAYVDANTETIASESGVDSTKNKIGQAITKIGSWISSDTNNTKLYNSGYENGKNITLGQAEGILDSDAVKKLRESAEAIGMDPATIVANVTDQHSPSKVFAALGANLTKGLAIGISEDTNLVANSSSGLAERAIAAFGNPLEYVSKIMSGELTYDPSIRPIMDMSSVRSGAMSINGMFQNQNVAVAGFSGRLAADIGQLQRDNQDVVDEIALLREDMADMTERMTNLQVVMNNGALVGQLAPGMDGEIGWRATRKGRGI